MRNYRFSLTYFLPYIGEYGSVKTHTQCTYLCSAPFTPILKLYLVLNQIKEQRRNQLYFSKKTKSESLVGFLGGIGFSYFLKD